MHRIAISRLKKFCKSATIKSISRRNDLPLAKKYEATKKAQKSKGVARYAQASRKVWLYMRD